MGTPQPGTRPHCPGRKRGRQELSLCFRQNSHRRLVLSVLASPNDRAPTRLGQKLGHVGAHRATQKREVSLAHPGPFSWRSETPPLSYTPCQARCSPASRPETACHENSSSFHWLPGFRIESQLSDSCFSNKNRKLHLISH